MKARFGKRKATHAHGSAQLLSAEVWLVVTRGCMQPVSGAPQPFLANVDALTRGAPCGITWSAASTGKHARGSKFAV